MRVKVTEKTKKIKRVKQILKNQSRGSSQTIREIHLKGTSHAVCETNLIGTSYSGYGIQTFLSSHFVAEIHTCSTSPL